MAAPAGAGGACSCGALPLPAPPSNPATAAALQSLLGCFRVARQPTPGGGGALGARPACPACRPAHLAQVAGATGLLPESEIEAVGELPSLESLGSAASSADIKVGASWQAMGRQGARVWRTFRPAKGSLLLPPGGAGADGRQLGGSSGVC